MRVVDVEAPEAEENRVSRRERVLSAPRSQREDLCSLLIWVLLGGAAMVSPALTVKLALSVAAGAATDPSSAWWWLGGSLWNLICLISFLEGLVYLLDKEDHYELFETSSASLGARESSSSSRCCKRQAAATTTDENATGRRVLETVFASSKAPALLSKRHRGKFFAMAVAAVLLQVVQIRLTENRLENVDGWRMSAVVFFGSIFLVFIPFLLYRFASARRWLVPVRDLSPLETTTTTDSAAAVVAGSAAFGFVEYDGELYLDLPTYLRKKNLTMLDGNHSVVLSQRKRMGWRAWLVFLCSMVLSGSFLLLEAMGYEEVGWLMILLLVGLAAFLIWIYSLPTQSGAFRVFALLFYLGVMTYVPVFLCNWMAALVQIQTPAMRPLINLGVLVVCQVYGMLCECVCEHFFGPYLQARFLFGAQVCGYAFPYLWIAPEPGVMNLIISILVFHVHNSFYSLGYYGEWYVAFLARFCGRCRHKQSDDPAESNDALFLSSSVVDDDDTSSPSAVATATMPSTIDREELKSVLAILQFKYQLKLFFQDGAADVVAFLALPIVSQSRWMAQILGGGDAQANDIEWRIFAMFCARCFFWCVNTWMFLKRMRPAYEKLQRFAAAPAHLLDLLMRHLVSMHYEAGHLAVLLNQYVQEFPELFACHPHHTSSKDVLSRTQRCVSFFRYVAISQHILYFIAVSTYVLTLSLRVCSSVVPISAIYPVCAAAS